MGISRMSSLKVTKDKDFQCIAYCCNKIHVKHFEAKFYKMWQKWLQKTSIGCDRLQEAVKGCILLQSGRYLTIYDNTKLS